MPRGMMMPHFAKAKPPYSRAEFRWIYATAKIFFFILSFYILPILNHYVFSAF